MKFASTSEKLPASFRIGLAYLPQNEKFVSTFDLKKQFNGNFSFKHGIELNYQKQYFLRAGYTYYPGLEDFSITDKLSFGAGFAYKSFKLDYSFSLSDNIINDDIHRFSFILNISKK